MIVTMEFPDFDSIEIRLKNDGKVLERTFTKTYIKERDEYLEKPEFIDYPVIEDTTLYVTQ